MILENIKFLRIARNLTQAQFAKILNMSGVVALFGGPTGWGAFGIAVLGTTVGASAISANQTFF